jgi:hypothetical protein
MTRLVLEAGSPTENVDLVDGVMNGSAPPTGGFVSFERLPENAVPARWRFASSQIGNSADSRAGCCAACNGSPGSIRGLEREADVRALFASDAAPTGWTGGPPKQGAAGRSRCSVGRERVRPDGRSGGHAARC